MGDGPVPSRGSATAPWEKAAQTNSKIQQGVASACSRNTPRRKG